jgi:type IV pilus assembly protein PilN
MRINVNLASRPYEDEGQFYRIWGTALVAMILLTALMITLSVRHYRTSRKSWAEARRAENRLEELKRDEARAQQILAEPQNRGTRDRSQFLNEAILRKSFSWTQLMEDLEKVVPTGVRVVSIAPAVDKDNRFQLKLDIVSETREAAVVLLRNLEKSPHFVSPQLTVESHHNGRGEENEVTSSIVSYYAPRQAAGEGD